MLALRLAPGVTAAAARCPPMSSSISSAAAAACLAGWGAVAMKDGTLCRWARVREEEVLDGACLTACVRAWSELSALVGPRSVSRLVQKWHSLESGVGATLCKSPCNLFI